MGFKAVRLKDQGERRSQERERNSVLGPPLPRFTAKDKATSTQLRCPQSRGPSLSVQPPCPEFLQQSGRSPPITPPPPGCPPASLTLSRRVRTGTFGLSSSPRRRKFLVPTGLGFSLLGVFSLSETRKLDLPNGQTQNDYRFFLQEPTVPWSIPRC